MVNIGFYYRHHFQCRREQDNDKYICMMSKRATIQIMQIMQLCVHDYQNGMILTSSIYYASLYLGSC